jgi:hypothetical protein
MPLQQECDYGNDNKDYYKPFCDFHRESGDPAHSYNKKHKSKDKKNYRKID